MNGSELVIQFNPSLARYLSQGQPWNILDGHEFNVFVILSRINKTKPNYEQQ